MSPLDLPKSSQNSDFRSRFPEFSTHFFQMDRIFFLKKIGLGDHVFENFDF